MIRENHVATDGNREIIVGAFTECHERLMNAIISKIRPASVRAAGYEIDGPSWKDYVKSSWSSGKFCHSLLLRSGLAPYK